jgi:tetratricopeptide (TPR) repeat protein
MAQQDEQGHDQHQASHPSPRQGEHPAGHGGGAESDPAFESDFSDPNRSTVIETNQVRRPSESSNPNLMLVPIGFDRPQHDRSAGGDGGNKGDKTDQGGGKKGQESQDRRGGDDHKQPSDSKQDGQEKRDQSGDRREQDRGRWAENHPILKTWVLPGVVALICGVAGAWMYSYFFGKSSSSDQGSSGSGSESGKGSGSSKGSGSGKGSGSSKGSGSCQGSKAGQSSSPGQGASSSTESNSGEGSDSGEGSSANNSGPEKLMQAETAWLTAVKELREAQAAEKAARRAEEDQKAVLDFLKRTLLSAGHPGDVSLTEAFWAGGKGADLTLRQALDRTESQVSEAFAERPLAEASVREMLGRAYLGLGDATQAVKQYERALALRQAMQGANQEETADCRNQLAVAYRLAGRADEGSRLFEQNPNSPARASALAVRGEMLLSQKKPAESELVLRECLRIRRKVRPEDWTTFATMSVLGEALADQKKFDEAEPLLLSGYEGMKERAKTIPPPDKPRITTALNRLVALYEAWGKPAEATRWRKVLEVAGLNPSGA